MTDVASKVGNTSLPDPLAIRIFISSVELNTLILATERKHTYTNMKTSKSVFLLPPGFVSS